MVFKKKAYQREAPLPVAQGVPEAVVDPVRNHDTKYCDTEFDTDVTSTIVRFARLGMPNRDRARGHTIANTGYEPVRKGTERGHD